MKIFHGSPAYRYAIDARAADCREDMALWAQSAGHEWVRATESRPEVSWARNVIVAQAIEARADLLIMQDADSWTKTPALPALLETMAATGAAVVSPVFRARSGQGYCVQPQIPGERYEVDIVGAALLFIDLVSLRDMPRPWFTFRYGPEGQVLEREDTGFCRMVRGHGHRVLADWTISTCHKGEALHEAGA